MIVLLLMAILATVVSILWSGIVLMANGMSDAPSSGVQGVVSVLVLWAVTAALWASWWMG